MAYFSHEENARNDPKLMKVVMRLGQAGKGVYWDLVEMLYQQGGYLPLAEVESFAFHLHTEPELITKLLNDFDLFVKDAERFWSESVLRRMNLRAEKSDRRAAAGAKGGKAKAEREAAIALALLEQSQSNGVALPQQSLAIKGKEIKLNETEGRKDVGQPASQPIPLVDEKPLEVKGPPQLWPDESKVFTIAGFKEFVTKMNYGDIDRGHYLPDMQRKATMLSKQRDEAGWENYVVEFLKKEKASGNILYRDLDAKPVHVPAPFPADPRDLWGFNDKAPE